MHAQFAYYKSPELGLNLSGSSIKVVYKGFIAVRAEDDNSHHTPFISIHDHAAICKWNQSTIVINYYQNEVYRRFRDDAAMLKN
ncbi:hypothetical protein B484DRAFT_402616 [Ochromonadaceae sp. CCMP2298]|nr:hypothetical protein B484DRAFT_402616 [Ochromonadaceae sp. CCMP2298]